MLMSLEMYTSMMQSLHLGGCQKVTQMIIVRFDTNEKIAYTNTWMINSTGA